jgi:molybdopterin-guanine dinucleotide biosynthesis protein A
MMGASGIVLAGGASRRMGRDKAWIELDGKPLVQRVIEALGQVCDEVIVVANERAKFEPLGVRIVGDEYPGTGSLGGLYSGLHAARNEIVFAAACDMPFLNPDLLRFLISLSSDCDIVIPSATDARKKDKESGTKETAKRQNLHPLHAVYRKTCLGPMREAILREDLRMISFHPDVRVRVVPQVEIERFDAGLVSMQNVNTPEELERAKQVLAAERSGI